MLGHGLGTPALGRRGAKKVLKHLFVRIGQRAHRSVLLYGLQTRFGKGCATGTAVPTLCTSHTPQVFGSLSREALAATGFRQVLGGISDEPGAETLRPL
eukprot:165734-Chlamydomonas_euryale.AAC.2